MSRRPAHHFEDGLRHLEEYEHTFEVYAKRRWLGKQLISVLCTEFVAIGREYFEDAVRTGKIRINGEKVEATRVFRDNDHLTHTTIVHEPPVLAEPPTVIAERDDCLVVNKPPSIPIHPGGAYRHNTLIHMLAEMRDESAQLSPLHRIDRLTSGIVVLAKTTAFAQLFFRAMEAKLIRKVYLARVDGRFDASSEAMLAREGVSASDVADERWRVASLSEVMAEPRGAASKAAASLHRRISVEGAMFCTNHKDGVWDFSPTSDGVAAADEGTGCKRPRQEGKHSRTDFQCIGYHAESHTSLLLCFPHTGRTHQIRVHLKHLGQPVCDDPCYNPSFTIGQGQHTKAYHHRLIPHVVLEAPDGEGEGDGQGHGCKRARKCEEGSGASSAGGGKAFHASGICLHAFQYEKEGEGGFCFRAPLPQWTSDFI
ncbi:unnamed protein product [Vitrella brassicaformis CCMP3155]|uniref:Pseudouridine synthase RsuA/RluA-like domain-containing protein n=2 Tax=Vitrella brassicaformis TaxID=1169539 RepID=A0A0G4G0I4_VITBC|nr:unnamed protein product [Vitrella brassicaformis CCMP3155]|eukprot:CEM21195.1 unnamed protein product [Vitrella brassicaformis CCMP3155]